MQGLYNFINPYSYFSAPPPKSEDINEFHLVPSPAPQVPSDQMVDEQMVDEQMTDVQMTDERLHAINEAARPAITKNWPAELYIDDQVDISDREVLEIFEQHPNLVTISITTQSISDRILREIGNRYPLLQSLNVTCCHDLTKEGFDALAEKCKDIKTLNTSNLNLPDGAFNKLLAANAELNTWIMKRVEKRAPTIGDLTLEQLSHNKQLTTFVAQRWVGSDRSIKKLVKGCPLIQELALNNWPLLGNKSLAAIDKHAKNLRHLDISGASLFFTTEGVRSIDAKRFETFNFQGLPNVKISAIDMV